MNQDVKQRWIAALRSGRYKRGNSYLSRTDSSNVQRFCCLGVLCDVLNVPYEEQQDGTYTIRYYGNDKTFRFLPREVTEALGITEEGLVPPEIAERVLKRRGYGSLYLSSEGQISLAAINDRYVPFDVIADIIEEAL